MSVIGDYRWISLRQTSLDDEAHDLDALLAKLYDDLDSKVRASNMIYSMSLDIDRLGAIASHGSAIGALARVLREEGKKSFALRLNTISTFFIFAFFQNFHELLVEYQIGRTTLNIIDLENLRSQNLSSGCSKIQSNFEQDKLLYLSVYLLFNLAQDVQIEKKMRKFNLVASLSNFLHKTNVLLLTITVLFLKKLSVFKENLDAIKESSVIFKVLHILNYDDQSLTVCTLRLLQNLSFERSLREEMVDCGLVQISETLLQQKKLDESITCHLWGVLYNLSTDLDLRLKISESKILPLLLESIMSRQIFSVPEELMALVVNLSHIPKTAKLNLEKVSMDKFLLFVLRSDEALLYKAMKNLSFLDDFRDRFNALLPTMVTSLLQCEPCIQVEVMGILDNIACTEVTRDALLLDTGLLHYLSAHLQVSNTEDDINLQIIIFINGMCSHSNAPIISEAGLVSNLCDVFLDRRDDRDIVLQSLYTFYQFLLFDSTKEALLCQFDKVMNYILELSKDDNKGIVVMADNVINAITNVDESMFSRIRSMRFNMYNQGWSEMSDFLYDL